MIHLTLAQFDTVAKDTPEEVPQTFTIEDDGTTLEDAVADASDAVDAAELEKEEPAIAATAR